MRNNQVATAPHLFALVCIARMLTKQTGVGACRMWTMDSDAYHWHLAFPAQYVAFMSSVVAQTRIGEVFMHEKLCKEKSNLSKHQRTSRGSGSGHTFVCAVHFVCWLVPLTYAYVTPDLLYNNDTLSHDGHSPQISLNAHSKKMRWSWLNHASSFRIHLPSIRIAFSR